LLNYSDLEKRSKLVSPDEKCFGFVQVVPKGVVLIVIYQAERNVTNISHNKGA
jgi:hypothetical protein